MIPLKSTDVVEKREIASKFKEIQDSICQGLIGLDNSGTLFREDIWEREGGGGGRTRVIEGKHIEKGGVNFSEVHGNLSKQASEQLQLSSGAEFYATGVSIVLHPKNPFTPIMHMNIRYFEVENGTYWFGGGIDLSPHYVDVTLAKDFHQSLRNLCQKSHPMFYSRFKQWADDYFYLPHRGESRGVGGIFFDQLNEESTEMSKDDLWSFVIRNGRAFIPIYSHQFNQSVHKEYNDSDIAWQMHRRGRYVEFNLVWDRGTSFGLHTNGRTESILMSLPPVARWTYEHDEKIGEKERETLDLLRQKSIQWI